MFYFYAGIAGVTASLFASKVVFTDANPAVLPLAVDNAIANGATAITPSNIPTACAVDSDILRWGVDDEAFLAKHGTFDVVIGSEVLYVLWVRDVFLFSLQSFPFITPAFPFPRMIPQN